MYNLKWIPTNFFKCSTCWHIFYITLIRYRFSPLFCKDHDLISSSYHSQKQGWWRKSKKYSYFLENRLKVISLNIYARLVGLSSCVGELRLYFRKLTNVNWRLAPCWERFHLALLYFLPLLISLMELVFLILPHQSSWCSLALPYVQVT